MTKWIISALSQFAGAVLLLVMSAVILNFFFTLDALAITPGDALYPTVQPLIDAMSDALKYAIPVAGVVLLVLNQLRDGY